MPIRRYLVLMLLSIITLVIFVSAIQGYKASMRKAESVFDNELVSLAQVITAVKLPKGVITHPATSNFSYQIVLDNKVVTRSDNAPNTLINTLNSGFKEANFLGKRWRTYTDKITGNSATNAWVIIAQPLKQRFDLAEDIILSAVTPIILVMPLLALIISLAVRQGLKPLTFLTRALKNKKANDLSPLTVSSSTELTPVIETLNELFLRLSLSFEREKQFASDAAHELRTPLSVLKINVYNLQQSFNDVILVDSDKNSTALSVLPFQQLEQSVERMAHVVDQILTLNRTNPEQILAESAVLNLQELLQECISELYPYIANRGHDIELNSAPLKILGNRFAIGILLKNLIANAAKYTPDNGKILVSCVQDKNKLILRVEDSGPGIAPEEYSRVFDRFYRVGGDSHNSKVIGCGLGLSIVKHIVELHQANISLSRSKALFGLCVKVVFSMADSNSGATINGNKLPSSPAKRDY
ncbi:MAG: two-component system sensor histidine kinase QseC [Cognaticolwellia sp.]|jgi:two-component system sensor histidine kinase QseC